MGALLHGLQASDLASSIRVLIGIVRLCFETNDWTALNENIVLLMKKRGQLKQVRTGRAERHHHGRQRAR